MNVLVTGFNKFGTFAYNPTQFLVQELENRRNPLYNLFTCILPTDFLNAGTEIEDLLVKLSPDIVILTGVASNIIGPTIERVALNIDDSEEPDNSGFCPGFQFIKGDGKDAYISDLSIEYLVADLKKNGIDMNISNHAGTFICNHVYYTAKYVI
jgi:pyroglutamyl-peptidase